MDAVSPQIKRGAAAEFEKICNVRRWMSKVMMEEGLSEAAGQECYTWVVNQVVVGACSSQESVERRTSINQKLPVPQTNLSSSNPPCLFQFSLSLYEVQPKFASAGSNTLIAEQIRYNSKKAVERFQEFAFCQTWQ